MGMREEFIKDQLRQLEELSDQDLTPTINSLIDAYQDLLQGRGLPWSWPVFSEGPPAPPEREG